MANLLQNILFFLRSSSFYYDYYYSITTPYVYNNNNNNNNNYYYYYYCVGSKRPNCLNSQSRLRDIAVYSYRRLSYDRSIASCYESFPSSFSFQYPLLSLRSSSRFLRLLPCLSVTSIPPSLFSLIVSFRRQFLRKILPIS